MTATPLQRRMKLSQLLDGMVTVNAQQDCQLAGLQLDSRRIEPGELFCALASESAQSHGNEYIQDAIARGAVAVLVGAQQAAFEQQIGVPCLAIPALRDKIGILAARFYGEPSTQMGVIGITGTSGKTTCKEMLASILESLGPGLKSAGNFNNLIGVPTVALTVPEDTEYAVFELGTGKPGDIKILGCYNEEEI